MNISEQVASAGIQKIAWLSEINLADSFFEVYSLEELEVRRDLLESLRELCPEVGALKVLPAVYLALRWKEVEEARGYRPH